MAGDGGAGAEEEELGDGVPAAADGGGGVGGGEVRDHAGRAGDAELAPEDAPGDGA